MISPIQQQNIQENLKSYMQKAGIDAWLMYSFHGSNDLAERITGFSHATRRWYFVFDNTGATRLLVQSIEQGHFKNLGADPEIYSSADDMKEKLSSLLKPYKKVAIEYSPLCEIPYVSKIDAGTLELLKQSAPDTEFISSAPLVQLSLTQWGDAGTKSHKSSVTHLEEIVSIAWTKIKNDITASGESDEYAVQQLILSEFEKRNLETNYPAIVATGANSSDPHYGPEKGRSSKIQKDNIVMIDLWAREKANPQAVYADITWMGYTAEAVPEEIQNIWQVLTGGRDAGVALIRERLAENKTVMGFEVDNRVRSVIIDAGYGEYFTHRTGHSIAYELHAEGVNMDGFELKDTREIIPDCGFSIEPGIYIPGKFGFRSEIDVHIDKSMQVQVYGTIQKEMLTL